MSAAPARPAPTEAAAWLDQLYGNAEGGWLSLFSFDRSTGQRHVDWTEADNFAPLLAAIKRRASTSCVWLGVATRKANTGQRRGGGDDCLQIPGFAADIDIAGPGHKTGAPLPRNREEAHALIARFPLPPTVVVETGGGLQPWWLFPEMADVDDTTAVHLAAWGATWERIGTEAGFHVDNVFDVARVLRVPGTTNRKEGLARPVTIVSADWDRRYGFDDLEGHLDPAPTPLQHTAGDRSVPYIGPERPGDAFNARHSGGDLLQAMGFVLDRRDRNGDEHWVRPGKEAREGTSATVYNDDGHTTIWSDTTIAQYPGMRTKRPYDPFGLYVVTKHGGNFTEAHSALRAAGYGDPTGPGLDDLIGDSLRGPGDPKGVGAMAPDQPSDDEVRGDWSPVDLSDVLAGDHQPPQPSLLGPPGGTPLFYAGRVNSIFGESGVGKTWVELAAIVEVLLAGGTAVLIDLEDTSHGIVNRLRSLDVDDDTISQRFIYLSPHTGWGAVAQAAVAHLIDEHQPALVCIDSTGEAMAASGVKGNDDDDVARWFATFPKWIARRGPAVLIVDHVPKDPNAPSSYAIGSQRKLAAITGAAYRIDAVKVPSRVDDGMLKVICAKDRHGNHTKGRPAAMVAVTHTSSGGVVLTLSVPDTGMVAAPDGTQTFRPTAYMERISLLLEATPGLSGREIESRVEGKGKYIREALRILITEGHVELGGPTGKFAYEVSRPYREMSDLITSDAIPKGNEMGRNAKSASRVPGASLPRPGTEGRGVSEGASPAPPPTGQGRASDPSQDPDFQQSASLDGDAVQSLADSTDHDPWDLGLTDPASTDQEPTP